MTKAILATLMLMAAGFTCDEPEAEGETFDSPAECVDACLSTDDHEVNPMECLAWCGAEEG